MFLLNGGWLWEKAKSLRGAVLICFYIFLLLSAPLHCLPKKPAYPSAAGERCQIGSAAKLPRRVVVAAGFGKQIGLMC